MKPPDDHPRDPETWPLPQARHLDALCDRFEAAWKEGRRPAIEDYLEDVDSAERMAALRELLALELEYRRKLGETPAEEEYRLRFPDCPGPVEDLFRDPDPAGDSGPGTHLAQGWSSSIPAWSGTAQLTPGAEPDFDPKAPLSYRDFDIVKRLGKGGQGSVYEAVQKSLQKRVALKILKVAPEIAPEAVARFCNEAQAAARFRHENIIGVHGIGRTPDRHYFLVMDFIDGTDLQRKIELGKVPVDEAARIVATVARAVHHAHKMGHIHRDLKPSNILIDSMDRPLLCDFGLAKLIEGDSPKLSRSGQILGTPAYMAPEQADPGRGPVTPRTDVHGLGGVLYSLLTGKPPYAGDSWVEILGKVLSQDYPPRPRSHSPDIPEPLESICLSCLRKDPRERPSTALEVAEVLEAWRREREAGQAGWSPAPPFDPRAPLQLGDYEIGEMISGGTLAIVFRARQRSLNRPVAIKVLREARRGTPGVIEWLLNEGRTVAGLRHPNIISVHGVGRIPNDMALSHWQVCRGEYFMVMDLIEGQNLRDRLRHRRLSIAESVDIAIDVTAGLDHAHGRGVVHCDIKPSNIIIDLESRAVIADFGAARGIEELDPSGLIVRAGVDHTVDLPRSLDMPPGTPVYKAPEQFGKDREQVTPLTDIYALGCVLYELLAGRPPFSEVDEIVGPALPTPPRRRNPEVPSALESICLRCLSRMPADRYASAREVREELCRWREAQRQGTVAPGSGADEEFPRYAGNLQFTVYRPRAIQPRRWYPLLAFAHLAELPEDAAAGEPDPLEEVRRQAEEVLAGRTEEFQASTREGRRPVPREGRLTFVPEVAGIAFEPPSRSFRWRENVHREKFRLRAPKSLDGTTLTGRMSVFLGSILVAEVGMRIRVDRSAPDRPAPDAVEEDRSRAYRKIFASYSLKDQDIVRQFERYALALGDEYLSACFNLRAGEEWSPRLEELIRGADIFQLFWSSNSMHSPAVRSEWEYALALGRRNFIRPLYWEEPMPACPEKNLPPEDLLRLHFQLLPSGRDAHEIRKIIRTAGRPASMPSAPEAQAASAGAGEHLMEEIVFPEIQQSLSLPEPEGEVRTWSGRETAPSPRPKIQHLYGSPPMASPKRDFLVVLLGWALAAGLLLAGILFLLWYFLA